MATAALSSSCKLHSAAAPVRAPAARAAAVRVAAVQRPAQRQLRRNVRCAAAPAQQSRWDSQVREGKVLNVTPAEAGQMLKEGWTLLDVRPPEEIAKAKVEGAVEVPLFVNDPDRSLGGLVKQATAFGMGGWWLGGSHMILNQSFLGEVQARIPKDAKVVIGCQKGLRSLTAAEQLGLAGYPKLAWVTGGFDTAAKGDLPVQGGKDIRLAGIGGLSEALGWTEPQQDAGDKGFAGGSSNIIKGFVVLLILDGIWFAYEFLTNSELSPLRK